MGEMRWEKWGDGSKSTMLQLGRINKSRDLMYGHDSMMTIINNTVLH